MRRVLVALTAGLVLAPTAWGATTATAPVYDSKGHLVQTPYAPANASQLTKKNNSKPIWLGFCAIFLLGLADLRRLWSLRNLDLLVLLGFTASLWYFNRGDIFTSVPLAYPPLLYLLARTLWVGIRGRGSPTR